MNTFKLDKDYRIEADTQAIVLITTEEYDKIDKKTRKPTGEKGEKEVKTWHPNIKQAIQEYLNQLGRHDSDSTLEDIVNRILNIEKSIENLKKLYHKKLVA